MINKKFNSLIFISLFLFTSIVHAEQASNVPQVAKISDRVLIPTGYGLTQMLGEDYYLARFSIDRDAIFGSAEDLAFVDAARRMEFKFISARKISGRSFVRKIAEGMKINNEKSALKENMSSIKSFMSFFRRSIKQGDTLRFDYHESFGTRVYLNKRMLGEISYSRAFYRCLLNVWVGDRPPSSKFKKGIVGQNGDEYAINLQQRYDSI